MESQQFQQFSNSGEILSIGNPSNPESEEAKTYILSQLYDQSWITRWLIIPVVLVFPHERQEEYLGDIYEIYSHEIIQKYPKLMIHLIVVTKTLLLIASALKLKLSDFI